MSVMKNMNMLPRIGILATGWMISLCLASTGLAQPLIVNGTEGKALPTDVAPQTAFTLAILPDRTTGLSWGLPYLEDAVEDLNRIGPDAVFTVGDMIQGYTRSMDHYNAEVDEYQSIVSALDAPFFPLPGNHDVISGTRNPSDRTFESEYQRRFGPLYYAAFFDHVSVVALYSDEKLRSRPELSTDQIAWAHEQVDAAIEHDNPLVMLMHKPLWRYRDSGWSNVHRKLAAAKDAGLDVIVIAGHFHSIQREDDLDGVEYHLVGTCGGAVDQHPLAGQLQHITLIRMMPGDSPYVYHQAVGCTLPDDFVLRADQDRAFRLKQSSRNFKLRASLDQPYHKPVSGTVEMDVENPIDVPITVQAYLLKEAPGPSVVQGFGFYGKTQMDTFNPHVMRVDTPFEQTNDSKPVTLQPGERTTLRLNVACDAQTRMIAAPQIHALATYVDSRDRIVPVIVRRRLPLKMEFEVTSAESERMPISAWTYSVYDRFESDPSLWMWVEGNDLVMRIDVPDNVASYSNLLNNDPKKRLDDPLSDTFRVRIGSSQYLIEPMGPAGVVHQAPLEGNPVLTPIDSIRWETTQHSDGFMSLVRVPLSIVGSPGAAVPFNLGIADNDDTYHTQWRSWSRERIGSVIVLPN